MGGHSHSSSSSTQNTKTTNLATEGDNDGVMIGGDNNTITYTDHGAVKAAANLASQSLQNSQSAMHDVLESQDNALDFGHEALNKVADTQDKSLQMLSALQGSQTANTRQQLDEINKLVANQQNGGVTALMSTTKEVMIGLAVVAGVTVIALMWRQS